IRVTFDVSQPTGKRVKELWVTCSGCLVPEYRLVDDDSVYKLVTNSYIAGGGSGYSMIGDNKLSHVKGAEQVDMVVEYVTATSPVRLGLENRINFHEDDDSGGECHVSDARTLLPRGDVIITTIMMLCWWQPSLRI
ncbi:apyrase-like, partial [Saccoglossus kowalevskii]